MSKKIIIALLLNATLRINAQDLEPIIETQKRFPNISLKVNVKDENNKPISEAFVRSHDGLLSVKVPGRGMESNTNGTGFCLLKFKALGGVGVYCTKKGDYYSDITKSIAFDPFNFDPSIPKEKQQNPLPFKKEIMLEKDITLRKIIKPIPLYAKHVRLEFPARNIWLGYDLELGDWTPPYGEGKKSDLKLRSNPQKLEVNTSTLEEEGSIEIDFGLGGGVIEVTEKNGFMPSSKMKMPHNAPKALYNNQVLTLKSNKPENFGSWQQLKNIGYFFKTRAKIVGGSVVSANYGKIFKSSDSAPFTYYLEAKEPTSVIEGRNFKNHRIHGEIHFTYYFNPTPNNTNLEMNLKKNLFNINKVKGDGYTISAP